MLLDLMYLEKLGRNKFDIVLLLDVIEHLSDPIAVLLKNRQVLKNNGLLLLSVPNIFGLYEMFFDIPVREVFFSLLKKMGLVKKAPREKYHINFWTVNRLEYILRKCGFKVETQNINFITSHPFFSSIFTNNTLKYVDSMLAKKIPKCLAGSWLFKCSIDNWDWRRRRRNA